MPTVAGCRTVQHPRTCHPDDTPQSRSGTSALHYGFIGHPTEEALSRLCVKHVKRRLSTPVLRTWLFVLLYGASGRQQGDKLRNIQAQMPPADAYWLRQTTNRLSS